MPTQIAVPPLVIGATEPHSRRSTTGERFFEEEVIRPDSSLLGRFVAMLLAVVQAVLRIFVFLSIVLWPWQSAW